MSLKPIESVKLNGFFKTGAFAQDNYHYFVAIQQAPPAGVFLYVDRLDALIARGARDQAGADQNGIIQWDPLGLDNSSPLSKFVEISLAGTPSRMAIGEFDQANNVQKLYGGTDPPDEIWPIDQTTYLMTDVGASLYPFLWLTGPSEAGIGGWSSGAGGDLAYGDFVFFETWGYALRGCARVRHTDNQLYRGLAQIDLSTGLATLLDVPTRYVTSPRALFEAPLFDGDDFTLGALQFVPDDDSAPAAPKGRVFLHSYEYLGDGNVANSNNHQYLKIIEFNPLGGAPLPGNPNRVHLRELTFTRLNFIQRQLFGTNPNSLGDFPDGGGPFVYGNLRIRYHPASRTLVTLNDTRAIALENERGTVRHSMTPFLDALDAPTPLAEVETAKTISFRCRAYGDLADPLAGVDATWSIERRSTIDEVLDTSGAPVSNVVAHPPIDDDSLVVEYLGTPLTEGVDYSVVEATGTITWMGAHSPPASSGYTASYRHSTVGATPAHGTLLQEVSETDDFGVAETRVQYPDDSDLVGDRDRITVSVSD